MIKGRRVESRGSRAEKSRVGGGTAWSRLLLAATIYGVWLYVDSFSFFRILFDSHLGWWYPVLVAAMFAALFVQYHDVRAAVHEHGTDEQC